MSFSAATCITFNPTVQPSTGPFDIYLNSDYTSTPIITGVDINLLTGNNCPYIIEVPDGTTNLGIKDTIKDYCITIPVQNNDICSNCNLGLSQYSSTTVSRLSCGLLTGTCQSITSYLINWYGPNNLTEIGLTSGFGPAFNTEWNIQHPFVGIGAIPLENGVYTPVIQKIVIEGITYSNTGSTGTILANLNNCLPTTTIEPLTCSNRTNTENFYPKSAYSHNITFESTSGVFPQPVNLTYFISATTKYIAIAFKGLEASDRLTLTFSGSNYGGTKIGLEDVRVGTDLSSNFTPTLFPKSANTQYISHYYTKIICLTGLTVSNNDKILIDVTPYNNVTSWDLFITCLDDYTCNDCLRTQPYKIIKSSITGITKSCNQIDIKFDVSGCSNNSLFLDSDYTTYYLLNQQYQYDDYLYRNIGGGNGIYGVGPGNLGSSMYFSNIRCFEQGGNLGLGIPSCEMDTDAPGGRPTSYSKSFLTDGTNRGVYNITGSSRVISEYYNGWTTFINSIYSGGTNPLNLDYYNYFRLIIPDPSKGSFCTDGETGLPISIHKSSPVITDMTGSDYYFRVTANTITNGAAVTNCDLNCNEQVNNFVSSINTYSTGTTNFNGNYTLQFLSGKYFSPPIPEARYIFSSSTVSNNIETESVFRTYDWMSNTLTFSGSSTLLPSLSGTVCNYNNQGYRAPKYNSFGNSNWKFYYKTVLINPSNVNDFEILASPITNFVYSGAPGPRNYELAYRFSGGSETYFNPTYII